MILVLGILIMIDFVCKYGCVYCLWFFFLVSEGIDGLVGCGIGGIGGVFFWYRDVG